MDGPNEISGKIRPMYLARYHVEIYNFRVIRFKDLAFTIFSIGTLQTHTRARVQHMYVCTYSIMNESNIKGSL